MIPLVSVNLVSHSSEQAISIALGRYYFQIFHGQESFELSLFSLNLLDQLLNSLFFLLRTSAILLR